MKTQLGRAPSGQFLPGNPYALTAALKSGARSNALVKQKSEEVAVELTAHLEKFCPHLTPADRPLVELAVEVLTQMRMVKNYWQETSGGSIIDRRPVHVWWLA